MPIYHIFGPAGSGKSTICNVLKQRGYNAIDTDFEIGLSGWFDRNHRRTTKWPDWPHPQKWVDEHFWLWDDKLMRKLLRSNGDEPVFFCGGAYNEKDYYASFLNRFGLHVNSGTIISRLCQRERDRGRWVEGSAELEQVISYNSTFEDLCLSTGATLIDSSLTPALVTDAILELL